MKKPASKKRLTLDKHRIESGLLCRKRLHFDCSAPAAEELSASRRALAEVGHQLVAIAQSVFPKGVAIVGETVEEAAADTAARLDEGASVLFGATFTADGVAARSDILVRHNDGDVDLYEVKSGSRVKQRYLTDLALQAHVLAAGGRELRAAFLLNLNPRYEHKEGTDFPPMQLLRSTDVTARVRKLLPHLQARVAELQAACDDGQEPEAPMGTWCVQPVRCPYHDRCSEDGPEVPVYGLPELDRDLEKALRDEGIRSIADIDQNRPGLSFVQRRTVECVRSGTPIVERFVRDELRQCSYPLHFVAIGTVTEALPQYGGQRPWRHVPWAWAATTLYDDGRVETASFAHPERTDPRSAFASALGKHVGNGGTVLCWDATAIERLRELLEDLPAAKIAVRAVIGRALVDLMQLFVAGVFHPALRRHDDFAAVVKALLDDSSGDAVTVHDEDDLREVLDRMHAPRIRATTRQKLAAEIAGSLEWRCEKLLALFRKYGEVAERQREPRQARATGKALPPS